MLAAQPEPRLISDLTADQLSLPQIAQCRQELRGTQALLRFADPLEAEYRRQLRDACHRGIQTFLLIGLVIWLLFAVMDMVRYAGADDAALQQAFWGHVFVPRACVMALGLLALWLLRSGRLGAQSRYLPWWEYGFIYLISAIAFETSNFYIANGIVAAKSSSVILIMVCFLPLGTVFYQSLGLAVVVFLTDLCLGYGMLPADKLAEHWMVCAVVGATLVISAFSSAMREKATRDQFLLRMLLRWEAQHDPLTGLANRRHFEDWARVGVRQARREQQPVALAIVDVDHFKAYNDHYGHQQGDSALQQLASLLQRYASRPLDLSVRLGGEEFAIICYGETAASLERRLQVFLQQLRAAAIAHAFSPTASSMTASIGICELGAEESLESLYLRADQALYQAKADGRDRIVVQQTSQTAAR